MVPEDIAGASSVYRFGPYELRASGELRKFGARIRLQRKPFLLLQCLAGRSGETVSRAELEAMLWPDVQVDFERNLNIAIKKVRDALCDSAERPRYVETVPGEGYRFIGAVEPIRSPAPAPESPAQPSEGSADAQLRRLPFIAALLLAAGAGWLVHRLFFSQRS